jgi:hypothetical protein
MLVLVLLLLLVPAKLAIGQTSYFVPPLEFPQIAIGGDAAGQNYVTIIQMVNNNSTTITARITLLSDTGNNLNVLFDGQGPEATRDINLAAGETRQVQLTLNGAITSGWMDIEYSPSDALTSVILQYRSGTTLLSEVGVDPVSAPYVGTDFAAETDTGLNTGIAIANPFAAPAYVLATLWDPAAGTLLARTVITLPPGGHLARFLTELFPNAANISQTRAKISLDSCASPSCNFQGQSGFLATAIRLNGDQFTTIPVTARQSEGAEFRILPQVAFGGPANGVNMKTILYLTTNVSAGLTVTAELFDNNGNALQASADGAAESSSIRLTVPGNRVARVVLTGNDTLRSGWIRLSLPGNVHLIASAVFQTFIGSNLASEASVLESPSIERGLTYVKFSAGNSNVGVALANSRSGDNPVELKLFDSAGTLFATRAIILPSNGHHAQFVTEIFSELASVTDFEGALSMSSSVPFSALALRLTADKIATLPVAANGMYRPSITGLRVTSTARTPTAQINFEIDVTDRDADIATSAVPSVLAFIFVDFGNNSDSDLVSLDAAAVIGGASGTLRGRFDTIFSGVPSGFTADLYIALDDAAGNASSFAVVRFRF